MHDVVAHVIGTESMLQGVATPEADIDVSTLEHVRNDIGVMNERWVRKLRGLTPADLLENASARRRPQRREALSAMGEAQWHELTATPAGPDSYGRFMRVRIFDCWMHEHDIRDAVGRPPATASSTGPTADLALDEMAASMGFVVGKLGGAPDGSRVRLELTGPLCAHHQRVRRWQRAKVVDDFRRRTDGDDQPRRSAVHPARRRADGRRSRRHHLRRRRGGRQANCRAPQLRDLTQ